MATEYLERELQVEVKMSPGQFVSIFQWMKSWIERLEKEGILTPLEHEEKEEEEKEE